MDNGDSRWCSVCQGRGRRARGESRARTVGPSHRRSQASEGGVGDTGDDVGDDDGDGDGGGDYGVFF